MKHKLNTDNPETMPITDAVYGDKPKHKPGKRYDPRGHMVAMGLRLSLADIDKLARKFPSVRRLAGRRKQEER